MCESVVCVPQCCLVGYCVSVVLATFACYGFITLLLLRAG